MPFMEECEGVAVCSKSLSHLGDVSIRFIEWIELLRAQGVDKIFLKVYAVHPNVMKVIIIQCPLGPKHTGILILKLKVVRCKCINIY